MTKKYYIYRITNTLSNKVYIGQTIQPKTRWRTHKYNAKHNKTNQYIHKAMNKHGIDNFTFEIIAEFEGLEDCNKSEASFIQKYNAQNKEFGYNIKPGVRKKGWKHSEETRQQLSESWHNIHSLDSLEKMQKDNIDRKHSEESIKKMSESHKKNLHSANYKEGYQPSEETKQRRRETFNKTYGSKVCNAPGCERTDGYRHEGVRYCEMHVQRIIKFGSTDIPNRPNKNIGRVVSEETRAKLSTSLKGRKVHNRIEFTEEQIKLIISYTESAESLAEKYNVSRNVIKRVRRENK